MWTVDRVKAELPPVCVSLRGKATVMYTAGRKLPFCAVFHPSGFRADYAWETVARSLNTNIPLRG